MDHTTHPAPNDHISTGNDFGAWVDIADHNNMAGKFDPLKALKPKPKPEAATPVPKPRIRIAAFCVPVKSSNGKSNAILFHHHSFNGFHDFLGIVK